MSTRVELYNSKQRPNKALSYDHMFGDLADNPVRTALLMPSSQCIDVIYLLEKGVITTDTHLYVVEQDGDVHCAMITKLKELGFVRGRNLTDDCCDLYEFTNLPPTLDLIFIDLFGSILLRDARWMASTLYSRITPTTRFGMTLRLVTRNNNAITEIWNIMGTDYTTYRSDFESTRQYGADRYNKPTIWMKLILHLFEFENVPASYNDNNNDGRSEMMCMRMSRFTPQADAYLSHADLEAKLSPTLIRKFSTERYGETAAKTKERAERSASKRELAEAFVRSLNMKIIPVDKELWVIDPDAISCNSAVTLKGCKTYHEICQHFGI